MESSSSSSSSSNKPQVKDAGGPSKKRAHETTTTPRSDSTGDGSSSTATRTIRYVEFYSGIGGWSMALQQAVDRIAATASIGIGTGNPCPAIRLHCCAALDHSDLCTAVYQHNFPSFSTATTTTKTTTRIETLTVQQLTAWHADLWMMSPPCQPHTRQHSNQSADLQDARSSSLLHLCQLLPQMEAASRPALILLENVVGFEQSQSCAAWLQTLTAASGYAVQQFHLQPTQVKLPNDRPRYYCVAVLKSRMSVSKVGDNDADDDDDHDDWVSLRIRTSLEERGVPPEDKVPRDEIPMLGTFLDKNDDRLLRLSDALLEKPAAWCLDIVSPTSRRTSCFTASYGKYLKGTGSVLLCQRQPTNRSEEQSDAQDSAIAPPPSISFQLLPPDQRQYDPDWKKHLLNNNNDNDNSDGSNHYYLRFFSGPELARLFDFSTSFCFPNHTSTQQQWKLMGNSLNVRVAARLVELGLRATELDSGKETMS